LQPLAPATLDRLIATCLAKDPEERWQSARDVSRELEWIAEGVPAGAGGDSARTNAGAPRVRRAIPWTAAAGITLIGILITASAVWMLKPTPSAGQLGVARLALLLQPGEQLSSVAGMPAALSPDGSMIVYASRRTGKLRQLYIRPISNPEAMPVPGTEDAQNPFFSPNGEWIGFFSQSKLKKVPVTGGTVEMLCEAGNGRGGSWATDDTIYFAPDNSSGLWMVPAAGGMPRALTRLDRNKGEISHRWPQVLPGGKALLLTVWTGPAWDETELQLLTLQTGERRTLARGARTGRYVASGHLIYSRDGTDTLMATPFDLDRLQVSGVPPVMLAECVRDTSEGGEYAVSDSGTLAYLAGDPQRYECRLVWVDRKGVIEPLHAPLRAYQEPVISPDGSQVAVSIAGPFYSICIYNLARPMLTPLAAPGSSQAPIWTPDGKRLVYRATRAGFRDLFWRAANGSGDEERLTTGGNIRTPGSWSPDGTQLFLYDIDRTTSTDIWVLSLDGDRKLQPALKTPAAEGFPRISPDGRWLAYVSDESGQSEVWVRPLPKLDAKWRVSTEGGTEPVWSRDGRELFYRNGDRMMSVGIAAGATLVAASPRVLFEGRYQYSGTSVSAYDVSPDGRRFLMVQPTESEQPVAQIQIVLNWFEDLKRRVAGKQEYGR
jgi:serine/threonine-protein kinase